MGSVALERFAGGKMPAPAQDVARPTRSRSSSTTSAPCRDRFHAMLSPTIPPPTTMVRCGTLMIDTPPDQSAQTRPPESYRFRRGDHRALVGLTRPRSMVKGDASCSRSRFSSASVSISSRTSSSQKESPASTSRSRVIERTRFVLQGIS